MAKNKMKFFIEKIKCAGCVSAIENALTDKINIEEFSVSLENKEVLVTSSLSTEEVAAILSSAGYPAVLET